MVITTCRRWLIVASVVVLTSGVFVATAEDDYQGSETCSICHEEVVAAFAETPHTLVHGWDAQQACESCHGPGGEHVDSGGEVELIRKPSELAPKEASQVCLACHDRKASQFNSRQSLHHMGDVACTDCHSAHSTSDKMIDGTTRQLCTSCHQAISAQFDLPRSHPLSEDGAACTSCHNPHGSRSFRNNSPLFDQACSNCHFEKAGPFLYSHDVINIDGCASCHEVHGSPNRHLLKHEPQVNLCYQCHSAGVTPTWHSVPRFLNEKCTACHTAIHGSNTSPLFLED